MTEQQMKEKFKEGREFFDKKQYEKAAPVFLELSDQGYADAQFMMGICSAGGFSVEKSDVNAAQWFSKAADQGNANAQNELGVFYQLGAGVEILKRRLNYTAWRRYREILKLSAILHSVISMESALRKIWNMRRYCTVKPRKRNTRQASISLVYVIIKVKA